jgi:hypothetical protein
MKIIRNEVNFSGCDSVEHWHEVWRKIEEHILKHGFDHPVVEGIIE